MAQAGWPSWVHGNIYELACHEAYRQTGLGRVF
jgi:hypothetical protein